nr:YdcH family protein [Pseudoxanthomonas dokdonensis]
MYAGGVDALDPTEINRKLNELKQEHRQLDQDIAQRLASIQADELTVKRLKKRKLWLKDCIARLESALIPDEPA